MSKTTHIAMWSGPRNLSTAMMRSFGARADTLCFDEPFYAPFLKLTGTRHPMREEILARHETDPAKVAAQIMSDAAPIIYQKQMTHHMVTGIPRDWSKLTRNAFLIRHPARVLASYARKMEEASLEAIGFVQQAEIYELALEGAVSKPVIIDSDDILRAPEIALRALCAGLEISFDADMLGWEAGPKPEDGAWAPHWYDAVNQSTGFGKPSNDLPEVHTDHEDIYAAALPIYEKLAANRIRFD